jgi:hypothetical protein
MFNSDNFLRHLRFEFQKFGHHCVGCTSPLRHMMSGCPTGEQCPVIKYLVVDGRHCKVRLITKIHLSKFTKFGEHQGNTSTQLYI